MGLNDTPKANRLHIAFFGKRNAGKSSVVNAVTGQDLAIVSDVMGTTTDPVFKSMELLPLGPVVIIDTPGIDDEGPVGGMRVKKALGILNQTDVAVLVVDASAGISREDMELIERFKEKAIPYIIAYNKSDTAPVTLDGQNEIAVSAKDMTNIEELKELIGRSARPEGEGRRIIGDRLSKEDVVVLVTPIDSSAPKGRLILPQVQTIRDVLDSEAICVQTRPEQLSAALRALARPANMVVTDSQAFSIVKDMVPDSMLLTSFSILFARYKGLLETAVRGVGQLDSLSDGDRILIAEGCSHHRQCEDIGTVKLPKWIEAHTGRKLEFEFASGTGFPSELSGYAMVVHCGGCMLNAREMLYRQSRAEAQRVPITNYGILISYMNGILKRSLRVFPEIARLL
ncbi:MAG: [FeFe] hydrogenase H-cluster maturation GTPase HydF [Candidatus Gastranaerophilaceae bacterium]|nr:[FeFe] hydrogenase H-cluster maturation GTPase HydF [Christensenellales bacterium]